MVVISGGDIVTRGFKGGIMKKSSFAAGMVMAMVVSELMAQNSNDGR